MTGLKDANDLGYEHPWPDRRCRNKQSGDLRIMASYEHNKLIERITEIDRLPDDPAEYTQWIKAGAHLELLEANAIEDELIIYAGGDYTFIQSVIVSRKTLLPIDQDDLLQWSGNPYYDCAGYAWEVGGNDVWIERISPIHGPKSLADSRSLVFGRTIEGLQGGDRNYFELSQEYAHVAGIHWRDEHGAYCRFDEHGDWEFVVSVTSRATHRDVSLVSFMREPLERYLAASDSILVRLFDFTLLNRKNFRAWPQKPEDVVRNKTMFYRQKVDAGKAAYTRGVQIVPPTRSRASIFAAIKGKLREADNHVEFIAHDWRNKRVANISTAPDATTNYFQTQGNDLPYELSPAFFRPEVLQKYRGDHDKYTVEERTIRCRGGWELRDYDVNDAGQVHAYICDLRELPYQEQMYWKSFNEMPKGRISDRAIKNDFEGKVVERPDPISEIRWITGRWSDGACVWWKIRDDKLVDRIYTPRTGSRDEWAGAFKELSKLIIECFSVSGIRGELDRRGIEWGKKDGSLALLERVVDGPLAGLRLVQRIRSKVDAHVGGAEADSLSDEALKQYGSYAAHFQHVCRDVIEELRRIEQAFSG